MSVVTVDPGALLVFDPSDKRVILFDFDALNLAVGAQLASATVTITAIRQQGATALTSDNGALVTGNRTYQARFLATTATAGDRYLVSIQGITNESPAQQKDYSITIAVKA